jgi:cytochrome c oxidase subunit 3
MMPKSTERPEQGARGTMADAHAKNHDYHLVDPSPWPIVGSVAAFVLAVGSVLYMHGSSPVVMIIGLLLVLYTMAMWWRDVIKEGQQGAHTEVVSIHMRYGMILFIASEVMFFVAWFWAYFDAGLYADEAIQATLILLTSGTTVTWAHHALLENDRQGLKWGLILTVALGAIFSVVQVYEYSHASFAFDRVNGGNIYSSTFYMATGFHGFHVLVGTIFLAVCLARALAGQMSAQKHFGFEAAAWYWHFVDVVWLVLFAAIYVWGSWGVEHFIE